ncbi:MAG: M56 family metallopeptidase, partial [Thermoguttaceae bacterium]
VVIAILVRLVAANRPQLAFVLWLVVFLKCVAPPLWSSPSGAFCWMQPSQTIIARESSNMLAVTLPPTDVATVSGRADSRIPPIDRSGQTYDWFFQWFHPVTLLTMSWGIGSVAVFVIMIVRWRRIGKLIRQADSHAITPYAAMFAELVRRLGIHRSPRLVVTEDAVGPAVLGFVRPTVLLPLVIVKDKSADEIEMILAHELMHVRRGDLWFALLRTFVQSLWWFHPLVWWAGRRASYEAERCSDEAMLAELRFNPTHYAHCLLDVLEIKQRLITMPAFPGIRAIEVNQGRLERIMKIGRNGYRRTPWWCWAVAFATAIAVLPGAAIRISAREEANDHGTLAAPTDAQPEAYAPPPNSEYPTVYSVSDVLPKIREEQGLSGPNAKTFLKAWVKDPPTYQSQAAHQSVHFGRLVWRDDELIVQANQAGHQQVVRMLEAIRQFGTTQIAVETRFVTIPAEELQKVLPDSTMLPFEVDEAALSDSNAVQPAVLDRPLGSHKGTHVARAQWVIEKDSPVRFRILNEEDGEKLINRCQSDARSNVLQAPKVTVFSGQPAYVSDMSKTPFFVGVIPSGANAQQPQIRHVTEGTSLQLRAVAEKSGAIHLDFAAAFSNVQGVETATVNRASTSGMTIQIPEVATIRMEGGAVLKSGQWLLLGGLKTKKEVGEPVATQVSWVEWLFGKGKQFKRRESQELIMMLRAERIQLAAQ